MVGKFGMSFRVGRSLTFPMMGSISVMFHEISVCGETPYAAEHDQNPGGNRGHGRAKETRADQQHGEQHGRALQKLHSGMRPDGVNHTSSEEQHDNGRPQEFENDRHVTYRRGSQILQPDLGFTAIFSTEYASRSNASTL
jgi:hypothetical protein